MNSVEIYRNIAGWIICSIVALNLYAYYYIDNAYLMTSSPILVIYFIVDYPFCVDQSVKIHHILSILVFLTKYFLNFNTQESAFVVLTMYKMEISTFFMIIRLFLDHWKHTEFVRRNTGMINILNIVNNFVFVTTFYKYRIVDYYFNLIGNDRYYILLDNHATHWLQCIIFYVSGHGFLLLNLTWCYYINSQIFKIFLHKSYHEPQAHLLEH